MHTAPTKLDRKSARIAYNLLQQYRGESLTPKQKTWVRLALKYYVSRWDLIPDFIPGIGILDDYLLMRMVSGLTSLDDTALPEGVRIPDVEKAILATFYEGKRAEPIA